MAENSGKPILLFGTAPDWEAWLEENVDHDGIRLQLVKKNSSAPGISYDEALEVALCFGWIDGQAGTLDGDYFLRAFTPRRPRSMWSQRNRDLVARLIEAGRMRPAGFAEIERAQADGRWEAAYRQKDSPVPNDLQAALDASPVAADLFSRLSSQNRFAILFRISGVKRPATRAANIAKFVAMLERGETIYPQKP
ncbi:YdeI/OmpD-associated family protein [Cryobacterium sp. RTS3]|nr:YdeI/OmpD-associated family protein [Cryobacterium sp. 5B3]MEA9998111.1 YdeI/OmpD-associated family protein [Cryobacterium sp. RTS3]MEB0265301.1 YdeI/OmpD-associated family protein [Cryobacterium sp. 10I5]MEB0273390.1 YdeI/OmpD-associated family protein [Cryobacterium sp. 5B3]